MYRTPFQLCNYHFKISCACRRIANATATYCDAVEDQSGGATGYPWQCRGYADFVITTCDHSSFNALEAPCARSEAETRRLMRLRRGCGYNDI